MQTYRMLEYYGCFFRNEMLSHNGCVSKKLHKLWYWARILVVFSALIFITHRIWTNWVVIKPVISQIKVGVALEGLGILSLSAALLGWNWVSVLLFRGIRVTRLNGMRAYFLANLARYMPGGIWHFAGRTLWLIGQGYNPQRAVESLVIEQGMILITGVTVGLVFMRLICWSPLFVASVFFLSVLFSALRKKCQHSSWVKWGALIVNYAIFWILYGVANLCFATAIVDDIKITNFASIRIVGQAAMSWVVGYIVFFVPGGWGIRELAFMHLLSQDFSGSIVFILPVFSRLAQILAELICGGAFSLLWLLDSSIKNTNPPGIAG